MQLLAGFEPDTSASIQSILTYEVLQSTSMVQMQMAHDNSFDVLDIIPSSSDRVGELHLLSVHSLWEEVGKRSTPTNVDILSASSLKQYQT